MVDQLKLLTFGRAKDCFSGDLLPPRARLVILHDEVLVVYPRKMKLRAATCIGRFPHQTGVTERSVGDKDGYAANRVLHHMVISNLTHRVGCGISVQLDGHHHITVGDKAGIINLRKGRAILMRFNPKFTRPRLNLRQSKIRSLLPAPLIRTHHCTRCSHRLVRFPGNK